MKTDGVRGKDGFIHDDDCLSGNGQGTVSGTGPCTCSLTTKLWENDKSKPKNYFCIYCRQTHEDDCPWKNRK